jgi:hypothetical protein
MNHTTGLGKTIREIEESGRCPLEICAAFRQRLRECEARREVSDERLGQEQRKLERENSEETEGGWRDSTSNEGYEQLPEVWRVD